MHWWWYVKVWISLNLKEIQISLVFTVFDCVFALKVMLRNCCKFVCTSLKFEAFSLLSFLCLMFSEMASITQSKIFWFGGGIHWRYSCYCWLYLHQLLLSHERAINWSITNYYAEPPILQPGLNDISGVYLSHVFSHLLFIFFLFFYFF